MIDNMAFIIGFIIMNKSLLYVAMMAAYSHSEMLKVLKDKLQYNDIDNIELTDVIYVKTKIEKSKIYEMMLAHRLKLNFILVTFDEMYYIAKRKIPYLKWIEYKLAIFDNNDYYMNGTYILWNTIKDKRKDSYN